MPCRWVDGYKCFGEISCLYLQGRKINPEDADSRFLTNTATHLSNCMISHERRP
jgi:hypothetical protein